MTQISGVIPKETLKAWQVQLKRNDWKQGKRLIYLIIRDTEELSKV